MYLEMQKKMARWHSHPRSGSPPADRDYYPWETRITPPHVVVEEERQRREAARRAREALLSPEQKAALEAAAAAKAEAARVAALEREAKDAARRAEQEAEAKRRALAEAKEREITQAGDEAAAAEKAEKAEPRTWKDLVKMRGEVETKKREAETEHHQLTTLHYDRREDVLRRKLGDAVLAREIPIAELLREWDPRDTDALGKADFHANVRATLPSMKAAAPALLDEIFMMLDELGTGLIFDLHREMLRTLRKMVTFAETEQLREASLKKQVDLCARRVELLDECIAAAEKWEELDAKLAQQNSDAPTLEKKLGLVINNKLGGSTAKLTADIGGAEAMVSKDDFVKYVLGLRNAGELKIDGGDMAAVEEIGVVFEKLVKRNPGKSKEEDNEPRMDVKAYLQVTKQTVAENTAKEEGLVNSATKATEKAKALQVAYARDVAQKEKKIEIEARPKAAL